MTNDHKLALLERYVQALEAHYPATWARDLDQPERMVEDLVRAGDEECERLRSALRTAIGVAEKALRDLPQRNERGEVPALRAELGWARLALEGAKEAA